MTFFHKLMALMDGNRWEMKPYRVVAFAVLISALSPWRGYGQDTPTESSAAQTSQDMTETAGPATTTAPPASVAAPPGEAVALETATAQEQDNATKAPVDETKKKKKKRKKVRVKARIHTRWIMEHHPDESGDSETTNEFNIRRARFKLLWEPEPWLMAKIQVGDFHKTDIFRRLLRDAYIHVSPLRFLEFRVGYFKKPFSRLALRSSGSLRVPERGIGNDLILDSLLYGGRDLGFQLSGRLIQSIELDYALGFFNGTGVTGEGRERDDQKDIVARLKVTPAKWLGLGVNGSFKFNTVAKTKTETNSNGKDETVTRNENEMYFAAGADAVMKVAKVRLHLEGIVAQNHASGTVLTTRRELADGEYPLILSLVSILSYKHKFDTAFKFAVEPVFMFEMLEPDLDINEDETFVFSPGFNSYFGKYFRVMIHGEFRRPRRNAKTLYPEKEMLYIQFCVDI